MTVREHLVPFEIHSPPESAASPFQVTATSKSLSAFALLYIGSEALERPLNEGCSPPASPATWFTSF